MAYKPKTYKKFIAIASTSTLNPKTEKRNTVCFHRASEQTLAFWELLKRLKDIIIYCGDIPTKYKEPIYHQTKWELVRDTRLRSQVSNNKPKHLVKKIIR